MGGASSDTSEPIIVGTDGFATLALSCLVILVSAGFSLCAAFLYVLTVAMTAPADTGAAGRILVLGMRLRPDGGLTPSYRARLDRAHGLAARDAAAEIVLLGGRGRPGVQAEAAAGLAYLLAHGVSRQRIRLESRSRHTLENLRQYRQHFGAEAGRPALLVTSRFHLARSALLARGLAIPHRICAAEARRAPRPADVPRLGFEAFLVHWYVTGRSFARLTGNRRMTARIS